MSLQTACEATRGESDAVYTPGMLIERLLGLAWRYRLACLSVLLLQALMVVFSLSALGLTGLAIDVLRAHVEGTAGQFDWPLGIAPPAEWSSMGAIVAIATLILAMALSHALVRFGAALAVARLTQRVVVQLRADVYDKLQRLSFRFYDSRQSSSIINRAAGDVQAARMFIDGVIIKVLAVLLTLGIYLFYMLQVHVPLTIACLATSPILWWAAVNFSRIVQPQYRKNRELEDQMVLTLVENFQGVQVVKGFARQSEELAKFTNANGAIRTQKEQIFRKISTYQPLMGLLTQFNMLVLLGYGGYLVVQGELNLGAGLFVFANLLHEFANQVGQITNIANTIQTSLVGAQRVFEVLDAPVEISALESPTEVAPMRGSVRFECVSFAYQPGLPVLEEIDLEVNVGECVAIVGDTGSGKSTLLSLIPRFYDVAAGTVRVDNQDIREMPLYHLRRNIGLVFQESFLFSNTIAANIAFGYPDATMGEIIAAARRASAHEFITELSEGYETIIGEHGSNLSGGQRQRLAIARALLLNPPILILDDAMASVDPETEHEIQEALLHAMHGRTTLYVSNRVSALRRADRIVVLQHGRIVGQGTHMELLKSSGYYRRLAQLQLEQSSERGVMMETR